MNSHPETILDSIIDELRAGSPLERVLEKYQGKSEDIKELAPILSALSHLPKIDAPTPYRERRYAQQLQQRTLAQYIFGFFRGSALPLGIFAGVSAFILTGFAANSSTPGQHLFTVKKSFERTTLVFTPESQKPQARLALVEKRLADAEEVLANPNADPKNTEAALQELANQTQAILSDVKKAADTDTLSPENVDVLNSLAEITKKQEELSNSVKPTTESIAQTTAEVTKEAKLASADIKRLIATVNDKAIAALLTNPNDVTIVGGLVSAIDQAKITVEKTVFVYDPATVIVVHNDQPFDISLLTLKSKVTITGTKTEDAIMVRKIVVLDIPEPTPATGTVKGRTTTPPPPAPEEEQPSESETLTPNNNVSGSFIPEQP